ncbi:MAG: hypothetical protein ACPGLV_16550 [Bacteroidia bacterium]
MKSNKILILLAVLLCVSAGFMAVQLVSITKQAQEIEEKINMAAQVQINLQHAADAIALMIH